MLPHESNMVDDCTDKPPNQRQSPDACHLDRCAVQASAPLQQPGPVLELHRQHQLQPVALAARTRQRLSRPTKHSRIPWMVSCSPALMLCHAKCIWGPTIAARARCLRLPTLSSRVSTDWPLAPAKVPAEPSAASQMPQTHSSEPL